MLPPITLDDEQFEEIIDKARKLIPNLYPEWTDYNYHDPGITILELLAWLKEIQQFYMDQIGSEHIRRYLLLLGEKQEGVIPAKAMVSVKEPDRAGWILKGSPFYAGKIPFETMVSRYITKSNISRIAVKDKTYTLQRNLHFPMFGSLKNPKPYLDICFFAPLEKKVEHQLYFRLFHDYEVKRNPIIDRENFIPLADIEIAYRLEGRFLPVEWQQDKTYGFLEDGFINLRLENDMEPETNGEYVLRIFLRESQYEVMPILEEISVHELEVGQLHTLCECHRWNWRKGERPTIAVKTFLAMSGRYEVYIDKEAKLLPYNGSIKKWEEQGEIFFALTEFDSQEAGTGIILFFEEEMETIRFLGIGDGLPEQELEIGIEGLCRDGMKILAELEEGSGLFHEWTQVEDFSCCHPENCCYIFDEEQGRLKFGDGIRGQAPEGKIILAAAHTSLGKRGNVKAETITDNRTILDFQTVINQEDAWGGRDKETLEECQTRMHKKLKQIQRAVTYEDYELLVKRTPGLMIEKVKSVCLSSYIKSQKSLDSEKVTLVVKPYSTEARPKLGSAYLENIRNMLEFRRLIGTKVSILGPEYIGIIIFAEIEMDSYYMKFKEIMRQKVEEYFQRQENDFGKTVVYGEIYGLLDVMKHVVKIKSLSLDSQGNGARRSRNGDIILPPNGLAYLKEWDCMVS